MLTTIKPAHTTEQNLSMLQCDSNCVIICTLQPIPVIGENSDCGRGYLLNGLDINGHPHNAEDGIVSQSYEPRPDPIAVKAKC